MNNEPMSDERLVQIRQRMSWTSPSGEMFRVPLGHEDATDLLAEVDRLRESEKHYKEQASHYHRLWSESELDRRVAEAALARVTDDSMAERLADVMSDDEYWTQDDEGDPYIVTSSAARAQLATIRAVAAGEQTEAMRCPGCDADPNAPHNGDGDCRNQHTEAPR